tara:strand:- start:309 stop:494 length:186 start_codon:yes stop_codon:yes gene_type:complete
MHDSDQETAAALAKIVEEWQRLEAWRESLEAEFAGWREDLLGEADRLGLGEHIRRRGRPEC